MDSLSRAQVGRVMIPFVALQCRCPEASGSLEAAEVNALVTDRYATSTEDELGKDVEIFEHI